jgi:hypothetical protein
MRPKPRGSHLINLREEEFDAILDGRTRCITGLDLIQVGDLVQVRRVGSTDRETFVATYVMHGPRYGLRENWSVVSLAREIEIEIENHSTSSVTGP